MDHSYSTLGQFLGGWFHQDFDLDGETITDVVSAYCKTASEADIQSLRADIRRFLRDHGDEPGPAFDEIFDPDIDPTALASSVRDFLETIDASLANGPTGPVIG